MARNRIIYQSEALYISPASTGYHLQSGQGLVSASDYLSGPGRWEYNANLSNDSAFESGSLRWSGINDPATGNVVGAPIVGPQGPFDGPSGTRYRSLVEPLQRIQSLNFDFTINRQDINAFGRLARLDSIVMESPTVNINFDYYLIDGENERKMGFNIPTSDREGGFRPSSAGYWTGDLAVSGYSALSGLIEDTQGSNYFILLGKEGKDLEGNRITALAADFDVISVGNGFISDYTVNASVGAVPTASLSVEGFNIKTDNVASGNATNSINNLRAGNGMGFSAIPAVDQVNGLTGIQGVDSFYATGHLSTYKNKKRFLRYSVPAYTTGTADVAALRPGDITFEMTNSGNYDGFTDLNADGQAHLQSMSITTPMTRTVLQRLGNTFGYGRLIDLPMNIDVSLSAIVAELNKNNLFEKLTSKQTHQFTLTLKKPNENTGSPGTVAMVFKVKNARLESENFSSAIGDNETVDIAFSCQVGGANDTDNGLFMEGSYFRWPTINYFPMGKNKDKDGAYKGTPPSYG